MNRNPTFQGPSRNRRLQVPAFGAAKRRAPGVIQMARKFVPNAEDIRGKYMIFPKIHSWLALTLGIPEKLLMDR
jgi:hypothetical protein